MASLQGAGVILKIQVPCTPALDISQSISVALQLATKSLRLLLGHATAAEQASTLSNSIE